MIRRTAPIGRLLVALVAVSALSLAGTAAEAGNGHGHGKWKHKHKHKKVKHVRYERYEPREVVVVERPVYVRRAPVYQACAPRYVQYVSPRYAVVRPTPYVQVGARIGSVDISAVFGPERRYRSYEYGCNFCSAHFSSFRSYDRHVHGCGHRPRGVEIVARAWDHDGYGEWRDRDGYRSREYYEDYDS